MHVDILATPPLHCNTREDAARLIADNLDCDIREFARAYMRNYNTTEQIITCYSPPTGLLALFEGAGGLEVLEEFGVDL